MNLTLVENNNPEAKNLISLFILNKVIRLSYILNLSTKVEIHLK